ncbi:Exosome component 10 [Cladochytrium tenue]|nr:Exosome component 10 [Cladochytrium tenue]
MPQHDGDEGGAADDEPTFEAASATLLAALADVTLRSQFLATPDLPFYRASSEPLADALAAAGAGLLRLTNRVLAAAATVAASDAAVAAAPPPAPRLGGPDDAWDRYGAVTDLVDMLLEKADTCLDQVRGTRAKRNLAAPATVVVVQVPGTPGTPAAGASGSPAGSPAGVLHAQNVLRPQLRFGDKVDNSNGVPFQRRLRSKDNARVPLDYGLPGSADVSPEMALHMQTLGITDAHSSAFRLPNPYAYEIQNIEYPSHELEIRPEVLYKPLDETPFTWVDTLDKLLDLVRLLDTVQEVAVDLEHHDYRSFQGFTCLIQVSTRTEDFIIDALELRSELHRLNKCFSNPAVVKVLHGAEMDVVWLQHDFGVYIVNLFDTYHASHVLEMSGHGLVHLLKYYCDVDTNKKYQMADWRIRPLTKEMLKYARMDTHYLLYIYDRMRNEILSRTDPETKQLLFVALRRSELTSLRHYEKEVYDATTGEGPNGWQTHLRKVALPMSPEHVAVYCAVHAWRDAVAREEDESPRYVLPNHLLANLALAMPTSLPELLRCCRPVVPNLVRVRAADLCRVVEDARATFRRGAAAAAMPPPPPPPQPAAPVHTRFNDDGDGDDARPAVARRSTAAHAGVETGGDDFVVTPASAQKSASKQAARAFGIQVSLKPGLRHPWGSLGTSGDGEVPGSDNGGSSSSGSEADGARQQRRRRAREIRDTLVLESPVGAWLAQLKRGRRDDDEPAVSGQNGEAGPAGGSDKPRKKKRKDGDGAGPSTRVVSGVTVVNVGRGGGAVDGMEVLPDFVAEVQEQLKAERGDSSDEDGGDGGNGDGGDGGAPPPVYGEPDFDYAAAAEAKKKEQQQQQQQQRGGEKGKGVFAPYGRADDSRFARPQKPRNRGGGGGGGGGRSANYKPSK